MEVVEEITEVMNFVVKIENPSTHAFTSFLELWEVKAFLLSLLTVLSLCHKLNACFKTRVSY